MDIYFLLFLVDACERVCGVILLSPCLYFWEIAQLFSKVTILYSDNIVCCFKSSPTLVTLCLFYCSPCGGYLRKVLICDFWWSMMMCILMCAYWPFVYLFRKNGCSNSLPVSPLGYLLFLIDLQKFFLCCACKSLIGNMIWEHFFQSASCLVLSW